MNRVRTPPGKPGEYWNFLIRMPGLEYTVYWNVSLFLVRFSTMFLFVMPLIYC